MRLRMPARPLTAGALSLATTAAVAIPAAAQAPTAPPQPAPAGGAEKPRISIDGRRLQLRAGRRARVRGRVLPAAAGRRVALQMRRGKRWVRSTGPARGRPAASSSATASTRR